MTDRSSTEIYKTQTRELIAKRARSPLSQDDEAEIAGQLHETWEALSLEERAEIEQWLVEMNQRDLANPLGIVERPFIDSVQIGSFLPMGDTIRHDNPELQVTPGIFFGPVTLDGLERFRIGLEDSEEYVEFHMDEAQAITIGHALLAYAHRDSASQITRGDASSLRSALTMTLDLASDVGDDEIIRAAASARTVQVQIKGELEALLALHEREISACARNVDGLRLAGRMNENIRVGVAINEEAVKRHTHSAERLRRMLEIVGDKWVRPPAVPGVRQIQQLLKASAGVDADQLEDLEKDIAGIADLCGLGPRDDEDIPTWADRLRAETP